jgi:cyanophycinase-like exopeptidase
MAALDALHRQAQMGDGSAGALVDMSTHYSIIASALVSRHLGIRERVAELLDTEARERREDTP